VAFVILPIFALTNGLVICKRLGVVAFTWLTVRVGLARLPEEIFWRYVYRAGWLELRYKASHGKYDQYSKERAALFISGLLNFVVRNPA
jgi:hypothetical protein